MNSTRFEETRRDQLALTNEIDLLCDAFESSWKRGDEPRIEDFLNETDDVGHSTLFVELVKVDLHYRKQRGESVTLQDYATRFPDLSKALSHISHDTTPDLSLTRTWQQPETRQKVGDYELIDKIGEGAFGNVWRALHRDLDRTVAVKLPSKKLGGPSQVSMFLHEARAAAKLDHPHIVRVHDFGEHEQGGYIVFGLIQGVDLKHWLPIHKPSPTQAAALVAKLADALDHAHQLGVVHRDLKPANVLMDGNDEPHITDFGLAKRLDIDVTIADHCELMGTIPYMSPEQIRGDNKAVDEKSDIYALGCMLYEMLTRRVPFKGDHRSTMYQVLNVEAPSPRLENREIPLDLETICLACLEKDPKDRYATAGELRDELQRHLNNEPIHRRPISRPARAWRLVCRNQLVASAFGFGGVALLSAAGLMAYTLSVPPLPEPGERMVTLTTEPEGAKVAFVPRDDLTGEPLPEQIIHCEERTPLHQSLPPGNYLVEAYLDDGSGRFHEVYRRVPEQEAEDSGFGGPYPHLKWGVLVDGRIEMPKIDIPKANINHGMAFIKGSHDFQMGRDGSTMIPLHARRVPSFYMDTTEVTVAKYRSIIKDWSRDPADGRYRPVPENWSIALKWDDAVFRAEKLGKRLPDEAEFEYAATLGGTLKYSWDDACLTQDCRDLFEPIRDFGSVGTPALDRLPTDPPIYGLCSNMAEWTMTHGTVFYPGYEDAALSQFARPELVDRRIVRGGDETVAQQGNAAVTVESRDPRQRWPYARSFQSLGISFRGVRSFKPRLSTADFVQVIVK